MIFLFPGQGAQYVGMGSDLWRDFARARYVYEEISDVVKRDVANICFNGPTDVLNRPENTSLGTLAHSVAIARILESEFQRPLYEIGFAMSGHSLGQYSALCCAGSMSLAETANLVAKRSGYMSMTGRDGGGMICIVGLNKEQVEKLLLQGVGRGFAAISNYNAADQFIISGDNPALDAILVAATRNGARIACRLNVAIPAHCALMEPAKIMMQRILEKIDLQEPKTNWFSNHTANIMCAPDQIKLALANQMTHGVRWKEIMDKFPSYNITRAYELGPGRTLARLVMRNVPGCRTMNTDNVKNVRAVIDDMSRYCGR